MRIAKYLVLIYGLFNAGVQVLLFREYLSACGGHDMGAGLFLATSFLWLAVGVGVAVRAGRSIGADLSLLLCLPVSCLQCGLILAAGRVLAAPPSVIPPLHQLLGWSLLITAPLSVLAGTFVSAPGLWLGPDRRPAPSACAIAAAGGCIGGLVTAFLLRQGVPGASIFMVLAVILCGAAVGFAFMVPPQPQSRARRAVAVCGLLAVGAALALRADAVLTAAIQGMKWQGAGLTGTPAGAFATSQGEYLYGRQGDQWVVVRDGRIVERIGDAQQAGRVAAMVLAHNYKAQRVAVIGEGLSVCGALLKSPQVASVEWFSPDPQYLSALPAHLPEAWQIRDERLHVRSGDVRQQLGAASESYDIVIVNLPAGINATLHRYVSAEFFAQVEKALTPAGFVAVGIPNDARAASVPAGYLGAWLQTTLSSLFAQTIVVPNDRLFFLAAKYPLLSISPTTLAACFSLVENAGQILPPEEVESIYQPERMAAVMSSYDAVPLPAAELLNRDRTPSYPLCHLLLSADRSGLFLLAPLRVFLRGGPILAIVAAVVLGLVRAVYALRTAPRALRPTALDQGDNLRADVRWIAGSVSAVGLGLLLVIMGAAATQGVTWLSCFAWGLSLFAGGGALGSYAVGKVFSGSDGPGLRRLRLYLHALLGCIVLQGLTLIGAGLGIVRLGADVLPVLAIVDGLLCGAALTLASRVLALCRTGTDAPAESALAAGLIGAALGAGLTSVLAVPVAGAQATLYVAAAWAVALVALVGVAYFEASRPGARCVPHRWLSPVAYGLFGVAVCLLAGAHIVRAIERSALPASDSMYISQWVEGRRTVTKKVLPAGSSKELAYQEVREGTRLKGYIFRSDDLTGTVYGYGGPMSTIVFAEPNGTLIDFRLTRSYETPRYMVRIRDWMARLKGKAVFGPTPLAGVNAVSGATYSSRAILTLLRNSGRQFAALVLAQEQVTAPAAVSWTARIDWHSVAWGAAVPLAFAAIYHGRRWSRMLALAYVAAVSGWWLNRQFSTDHVLRLLDGENVLGGSLGSLALLIGVPVLIALVGDIYCGYLCPFGALQELLGLLVPARLKPQLSRRAMVVGRYVKYAVLFALVVGFVAGADKRVLGLDPLLLFFNRQAWLDKPATAAPLVLGLVVLAAGLFVTRLWCRYLCPTGAFLSLFNLGGWLQRFLPAKKFGKCEFGLTGRDRLDCIHCDRCRH